MSEIHLFQKDSQEHLEHQTKQHLQERQQRLEAIRASQTRVARALQGRAEDIDAANRRRAAGQRLDRQRREEQARVVQR